MKDGLNDLQEQCVVTEEAVMKADGVKQCCLSGICQVTLSGAQLSITPA